LSIILTEADIADCL